MWQCPDCDESIEPSLDICWNCGTSRDGERNPDFKSADDLTPSDTANLSQVNLTLPNSSTSRTPQPLLKIRFGLRTMFGIVAICAVVFAKIAWDALPKTPDDFFFLGIAHMESEEYPEAIVDFTRAIELTAEEEDQTNLPVIYSARALAHHNQEDYADSLRDVSQAIDFMEPPFGSFSPWPVDPHGNPYFIPQEIVAQWYLMRADALIALGEKERAIPDLNIVLQSDPKSRIALDLLAIAEGHEELDN